MQDGYEALERHVVDKAEAIKEKYGRFIDMDVLEQILNDREFVKHSTRIEFDSKRVKDGFFAVTEKVSSDPIDGYVIYVHEHFKNKTGDVPALVLYHLVSINYGDFATCKEAELFGATVLGMDQEYYYSLLCRLADSIEKSN